MFCTKCGRETQEHDAFCPGCGIALRNVPLMPAQSRIAGHLRLLGILWVALSAFRFVPALILISMEEHGVFRGEGAPPFLSPLIESIAVAILLLAVAGIITGWGLLVRQPWARMLAIVMGAIGLVDMPFGTALGIYTFWVLLPVESEAAYQRISRFEATGMPAGQ